MKSTHPKRARERFRPSAAPPRGRFARIFAFLRLSLAKAGRDALPIQSAALAFITVLSLVPLLASLSHFSAGFFTDRHGELVDLLGNVLPYTETSINEQLRLFVDHSSALRGFGLVAFLFTALTAFHMIETTINAIWDVSRRRSFRRQLTSFVILLAWGPILIGATYSALFLLRQQPAFEPIAERMPLHLITFPMTWLGLTMLNWQVPHTRVEFRHAALGGASSALLLEVLRVAFGSYTEQVPHMSLVYGSFGFALLFMLSIQLAWAIVLIGTEIAYCGQHFDSMSRPRRDASAAEGSWFALAAIALIIDRFRNREPITPHELLGARLGVPTKQLNRILEPLVKASILQDTEGGVDGYLLACDPYKTSVASVFDIYEAGQWAVLDELPRGGDGPMEGLRERLADARFKAARKLQLSDLLPDDEPTPGDGAE